MFWVILYKFQAVESELQIKRIFESVLQIYTIV